MTIARLAALAVLVVLGAAILWAAGRANLLESFAAISADPWGVVTLIDLYAAFVLMAVVIGLLEPRRWITVAVVLLTPVLGSLVPAAWLLFRGAALITRPR